MVTLSIVFVFALLRRQETSAGPLLQYAFFPLGGQVSTTADGPEEHGAENREEGGDRDVAILERMVSASRYII